MNGRAIATATFLTLLALGAATASDQCTGSACDEPTSLLSVKQTVHTHRDVPKKVKLTEAANSRMEAWAAKIANRTEQISKAEAVIVGKAPPSVEDKQKLAEKAKDVKNWVSGGKVNDKTALQIIAFMKNSTVEGTSILVGLKEMISNYADSMPQKVTLTPRERAILLEKEVWDSMDYLMDHWIKVQDLLSNAMDNTAVALKSAGLNQSSLMVTSLMEPVFAISGDPEEYGLLGEMNYIPQYVWPFDLKTYPMKRIELHVAVFERHLKQCQDMAKNFTGELDKAWNFVSTGIISSLATNANKDALTKLNKDRGHVTKEMLASMDLLFAEWYHLVTQFKQGGGHKEIYGIQGNIKSLMNGEKPDLTVKKVKDETSFLSTAIGMFLTAAGVGLAPGLLVLVWWVMKKRSVLKSTLK